MTKFSEPPSSAELQALGPELRTVERGTLLWRVYFQGGAHSTRWDAFRVYGPTNARFDHHLKPPRIQARGILYAAEVGPTCLAEVFQDTRVIDRMDRSPWLVAFELTRDLALLDLTGAWPTRAGASTAIHSGPRARARRWSAAIYGAFPNVAGLKYASSMNANQPAFAFYERASSAMPGAPKFHRALADPALRRYIDAAAQRFNYALV
jgi:hypothetical protein